jgi:ribosomal protein S18 acetylase RimI-like enzyme
VRTKLRRPPSAAEIDFAFTNQLHEAVISFRDATRADLARVIALVTSAYRGDASRAGWTTEADMLGGQRTDEEAVGALIDNPDGVILLAERDGELIACANVSRSEDGVPGEGYFGMFAVEPTRQGGGIGNAVLAEAERILQTRFGCRTAVMTVIERRTELIPYYERRGWKKTGKVKPFPYGDERYGVPQRDDLRFLVLEKRW